MMVEVGHEKWGPRRGVREERGQWKGQRGKKRKGREKGRW